MKQFFYFLLTVCLVIGASAKLPNNITDCTSAQGHKLMVVNNATIQPNPMVPGKMIEINLDVELYETVTSGLVLGSIYIIVDNKRHVLYPPGQGLDLCMLLSKINKKCPLQKGQQKLTISQKLPLVPPQEDLLLLLKAVVDDQNGNELLCWEYTLDLRPHKVYN